jgi:acyl carrier protein
MQSTISEFTERLGSAFQILSGDGNIEQASLLEDLGFDSLQLLELVDWIEAEAAIDLNEWVVEFPVLITIEDAFSYYEQMCEWKTHSEQK